MTQFKVGQTIEFNFGYYPPLIDLKMEYIKTDFSKEKPTKSGKYFTWNEIETINGKQLEMQTTTFDLERNKIWNTNPVKFWLKPNGG